MYGAHIRRVTARPKGAAAIAFRHSAEVRRRGTQTYGRNIVPRPDSITIDLWDYNVKRALLYYSYV